MLFNIPVLSVEVINMKEYHAQDCATAKAVNYQPLTLEARAHPGQFLLNLWRTKEQWDRSFSKYYSLPCHYQSTNPLYSFIYSYMLPVLYNLSSW